MVYGYLSSFLQDEFEWVFFHGISNSWENPSFPVSQRFYIKMRIWWKRDIKTLRKVWVWIFQTLPMNEFCCIFSCCRILVGPAFFPCDEVYIGYYGNIHALGKNIVTSFPGSPHKMQFAAFSQVIEYLWEDLCIFHVMKYHVTGIWWKKAPTH